MKVANTGFHPRGQCPLLVIPVLDTGMALLHRSSEKNWQLLTKFIINSHLTVEEKICHKK
ncbi:hypothetical protein [Wolbachia sp. wLmal]|uniref:hypothetical protein n=1 Tax=Wolbachia sp. wLmal TaxID=3342489 RepID=UPI003C2BF064